MSRSNVRVPIVVAIIGLVGTLGAALIANWGKIFPPGTTAADSNSAGRQPERASRPEQAVRELIASWQEGNRAGALKVADAGVVDRLFAATSLKQSISSREITCYVVGTGQRDCQIPQAAGGIATFCLRETDRGWRIASVEY